MNFIKGMDVSMLQELEDHGAEYFLNGEKKDIFKIFKESGIDMVRLRLWVDPYNKEGEPYGGGTNDLHTTIRLAKRLKEHELAFMLDFHYSDFWTDPSKQIKPKSWSELTGENLVKKVYSYTLDTLKSLRDEGITPEIVQVGNEITKGFLWPDGAVENTKQMAKLLEAGIKAVKDFNSSIEVLLHLDFGTDNELYKKWFSNIVEYNLNYDIIGMSYYPFWNGSLEELLFNMNDMSQTYGKKIMIAETAMGYTTDNLGCNGMIFGEECEKQSGYPATEEGQFQFLEDLVKTIKSVDNKKGIGFIYWEPSWLPIPECTWASKEGCIYINDKGEIGNSWANQALFDKNGNANKSILNMKNI